MIKKILSRSFSSHWCLHCRDPASPFIFAYIQQQCFWLPPTLPHCVDVANARLLCEVNQALLEHFWKPAMVVHMPVSNTCYVVCFMAGTKWLALPHSTYRNCCNCSICPDSAYLYIAPQIFNFDWGHDTITKDLVILIVWIKSHQGWVLKSGLC